MSLLAPLYALGLLAIAAPIVFHLIRRTPRGEVPFSSLMFLSPSPPRLTRRSRLDHWLLLLLRAAALGLLAFAFARPFLRQAMQLDPGDVERRRVVLLIDTSASMRRGDLWPKAKAMARAVIDGCRPTDQLALFAFGATTRPLLGFDESATLDPARRRAVALAHLDRMAPTWEATHLGQALIDAVAAIEDVADASGKAGRMPRRVVLVGDLQQGSRLEALGDFEWPSDVELELKTVSDNAPNAGLQRLADQVEGDAPETSGAQKDRRVRVTNDAGSRDRFELSWVDDRGTATGKPIDVYVPPGEGRVVRVPRPADPDSRRSLRLRGDAHAFDNTLYFSDDRREEATVLYVGNDAADDPSGLLYYLQRVFADTPRRGVRVVAGAPSAATTAAGESGSEAGRSVPLAIVTTETAPEDARRFRQMMRDGATVLDVITAPGRASTLAAMADVPPWDVEEAAVGRDTLLGAIAFDHPLFAPMAGAQFNDFTKIHFWRYRHLDPKALGDVRVLARFENGDAAVVEKAVGRGRLVVMAAGWQPADSQLARSSKFVPLMSALLEGRDPGPGDAANYLVSSPLPLPPAEEGAGPSVVHRPDGTTVAATPGSTSFDATDRPGVYSIEPAGGAGTSNAAGTRSYAVNLDPMESKTAPLHVETLEQFGCRLANHAPKVLDPDQLRQMHNVELEGRQKLWRWLILAAIGVLIVETWLAGRLVRPLPARAEVLTT